MVECAFAAGDRVVAHGLCSDAGQAFNGAAGIVKSLDAATGCYQVDFQELGCRAFKPENLEASEQVFAPGERVVAHGLSSEAGRALNGAEGVVKSLDPQTGRYQVDFAAHGSKAFKGENLRMSESMPSQLEALLAPLSSEDADARFRALRELAEAGAAAGNLQGHVAKCLEDPSWRVRGAAAEALGKLGAAATHADSLANLLKDDNGDVRFAAAEALGRGGAASQVEALARTLQDPDDDVRMAAAVALGKAGSSAAAHAGGLAELLSSPKAQLRMTGANSLAALGEAAAPYLDILVQVCEGDADEGVRMAAALAVVQSGDAAAAYEERMARILEALG